MQPLPTIAVRGCQLTCERQLWNIGMQLLYDRRRKGPLCVSESLSNPETCVTWHCMQSRQSSLAGTMVPSLSNSLSHVCRTVCHA